MKTLRFLVSGAAAWLLAISMPVHLAAAEPSSRDAAAREQARDFASVEQFLGLSDAELDEIREVIERIRAMTPAQRVALRDEIAAFRRLPEPQRRELRQGWGRVPPEIRDGWRELMHAASPEQRNEIHATLQALSPEERLAYRQKLVEEYLARRGAESTRPTPPEQPAAGKR